MGGRRDAMAQDYAFVLRADLAQDDLSLDDVRDALERVWTLAEEEGLTFRRAALVRAIREVALALDVDPHRASLQETWFEYCCDGDGIVQRRGVEAERLLVGGDRGGPALAEPTGVGGVAPASRRERARL